MCRLPTGRKRPPIEATATSNARRPVDAAALSRSNSSPAVGPRRSAPRHRADEEQSVPRAVRKRGGVGPLLNVPRRQEGGAAAGNRRTSRAGSPDATRCRMHPAPAATARAGPGSAAAGRRPASSAIARCSPRESSSAALRCRRVAGNRQASPIHHPVGVKALPRRIRRGAASPAPIDRPAAAPRMSFELAAGGATSTRQASSGRGLAAPAAALGAAALDQLLELRGRPARDVRRAQRVAKLLEASGTKSICSITRVRESSSR